MTEHTDLDTLVHATAHNLGVRAFHWADSTRCTALGWPDWTLLTPGHLAFIEVKSWDGRLTPAQTAVRYAIEAAGLPYHVARPHEAGELADIIRELTS